LSEERVGLSEPTVTRETRGHLLLVGLNRAKKKNAFNLEMLRELSGAFTRLEQDPSLRAGVVFAHGPDFTGGLDLMNVAPAMMAGEHIFPETDVDPWGTHGKPRTKPVVVAVRGRCLTLGIELLLNADVCVAGADTVFAQIEIKRGLFPFGGGTARWVERVGWGNAMRWLLTGDELDVQEAHRIGLVQEVVAPELALPRAIEIAERIAAQAPLGVAATLRSSQLAINEGPEASMRALLPELQRLMTSDDAREGLASFVERREARFTGR
jgi:enoyl-CoA hydratase